MNHWYEELVQNKTSLETMESRLFNHPELGFKEQETRRILLEYLYQNHIEIDQDFNLSGFSIKVGNGKPHIALIAEMDALVVLDHPNAGKDGAAHACGHHLQTTILSHVFKLWKDYNDKPQGTLSCFFIAAEEFVDLDFRLKLQEEKKIELLSGKQNLILQDAFKDVDCFLSVHTMGETSAPSMEINASLSGFIYKKFHFKGQAAHAAVMPHLGINALNAQILTQNAFALLRETFQEDDRIRLHLITTNGGHSVNSVPSDTILEGYVRSINPDKLLELNEKLNHVSKHCAQALFASVEIEDRMGYMPLIQSNELNQILLPYILDLIPSRNIIDQQKSFAAGDMGDLSLFKPTIQLGFSGCSGLVHGKNFCMANSTEALIYPAYVLLSTLEEIMHNPAKLDRITAHYPSKMSIEDYRKMHNI